MFCLQTRDSAGGHRAAYAQVPPDVRVRMAQPRSAAESQLVTLHDPHPRATRAALPEAPHGSPLGGRWRR